MNQRPIDKLESALWFREGWCRAYHEEIYSPTVPLRDSAIHARYRKAVRRCNDAVAVLDGKNNGGKDNTTDQAIIGLLCSL